MYDVSGGGSQLRKHMSINLCWWHNLKQASHTIWKKFSDILWAPLWHHLYPDSAFFKTNQSPQDELVHMLHAASAWPDIRDQLVAMNLPSVGGLSVNSKSLVANLIFLFDYAIPAVKLLIIFILANY